VDGSFANFKGTIVEIDQMLGKVLVNVQTFANRSTEQWINMEDVMKEEEE
jgi:transcription antitermination factor NusG